MMQNKSFYSIQEVTELTGKPEDFVFSLMQPGGTGRFLAPAYEITIPMSAQKIGGTGEIETLPVGAYEVDLFPCTLPDGISYRCFEWRADGTALINSLIRYCTVPDLGNLCPIEGDDPGPLLYRSGDGYLEADSFVLLADPFRIHRSEVVVLHDSLANYLASQGKSLVLPQTVIGKGDPQKYLNEEPVREVYELYLSTFDSEPKVKAEKNSKIDVQQHKKVTKKRVRTRSDAMDTEINYLIRKGTPCEVNQLWIALIERCGKKGSCCLSTELTDKGEVIVWKGAQGNLSRLRIKVLSGRLSR